MSCYLLAGITAMNTGTTIVLTVAATHEGHRVHGLLTKVIGLTMPVAIALAIGAMYVLDRRGKTRTMRTPA